MEPIEKKTQTLRERVSAIMEPSRGRQAAVALLLTWLSFLVVNLFIGLWKFPSLTELHAPSFLRQAELIRVASGGRDNPGDKFAAKGDEVAEKKADDDEFWNTTARSTLPALDALDGIILPGAYGWPEDERRQKDASDSIHFDDYEKCKLLFREVANDLKNPFLDVKRFRIEMTDKTTGTNSKHVVLLLSDGNWVEQDPNIPLTLDDNDWVVHVVSVGDETLLDANNKLNFDEGGLNKLCTNITNQMEKAYHERTTSGTGSKYSQSVNHSVESHFTCSVERISTEQPAEQPPANGEAATPSAAASTPVLNRLSFSANIVPGRLFSKVFPPPGEIVSLFEEISKRKLPQTILSVQEGLLTLWGLIPVPDANSNKDDQKGNNDKNVPVELESQYPISGDPWKARGAEPCQRVSVVWFNARDRHQSPFVAVLSFENSWVWGQKLTCRYHLVRDTKMVSPSPDVERVLFWRGPFWLGWRPCSYDSTASQAATEFISLYERTSGFIPLHEHTPGGFPATKSVALPSPQKVEQIRRWVEGAIQDQIWFDKFRESEKDLTKLDPLRKPAVDEFTSFARRVNGGGIGGLIQVLIVIAFWYGALSLLFSVPGNLKRQVKSLKFSLEVMPLLGFLGTVLGISNALLGASGILSDDISEKQRVVSNMTHQLATAFDTTFVALCGSLLFILLVKVSRK